ncbi:MAG: metallophosphoesterase [Spirochaetaceae bacterium]|nr:metallophosphoesterase [Spirochaetaceae bacterium]
MTLAGCATHASLKTVYYDITARPSFYGQTVVITLISDLHSDIYGKDQSPLLQRIYSDSPDIIVLSGDIYDDVAPRLGTRLLLAGIKQNLPQIPVFYVTGNHEYDGGESGDIVKEISDFGVTVLSDDYAEIEVKGVRIVIAGIEDPNKKFWDPFYDRAFADGQFKKASTLDAYKILVCHRPEIVKYYTEYKFDLVLSGHTHGGQARLPPLINGFYAPGQGLFPKYSGGVYKIENTLLVVSRGLTTRHPRLPRIFNPPELVVIRLGGYN